MNEVLMDDFEVVEANTQFVSMWKVFAGDRDGADLTDRVGLATCWADGPIPFLNSLFLSEETSDAGLLTEMLRDASDYMRAKRQPGFVFVCDEYLSGPAKEKIEAVIRFARLEYATSLYGMVGNILPLEAPRLPTLQLKRVTDEIGLQDFADVNTRAYNMWSLEAGRAGIADSTLWKDDAFTFVGYENGRPVSAASAVVNDGQIYLALVATSPESQRKGYGEATVRHVLQEAHLATGWKRTNLHATDAGVPLYSRIGYHMTTRFLGYTPASSRTGIRRG